MLFGLLMLPGPVHAQRYAPYDAGEQYDTPNYQNRVPPMAPGLSGAIPAWQLPPNRRQGQPAREQPQRRYDRGVRAAGYRADAPGVAVLPPPPNRQAGNMRADYAEGGGAYVQGDGYPTGPRTARLIDGPYARGERTARLADVPYTQGESADFIPQPSGASSRYPQGDMVEGDPGPEADCGYGGPCGEECFEECGPVVCQPLGNLWFRGEYLMWWSKSAELPPLATTSPDGTPRDEAGVLDQPGTTILFGNGGVEQGLRSGGRFQLGYWFGVCQDWAIEVDYMFLGSQAVAFDQSSAGSPILARPFFNAQTALQDSGIIAYTDPEGVLEQSGSLNIRLVNDFSSAEVLWRRPLMPTCRRQVDFLVGYRYGRFAEGLTMDEQTTYHSEVGDIPVGTVLRSSDVFDAVNEFNGAEVGISVRTDYCRFSLEVLGKLALGKTRSTVLVDGSTVIQVPDEDPVTRSGGFLALPTNMGTYDQSSFSVMPELGATLSYQWNCRLRLNLGYTFLYWSRVARPGDQLDLNVNPSQFYPNQLQGFPAPQFQFTTADLWVQGLNFGMEYRF